MIGRGVRSNRKSTLAQGADVPSGPSQQLKTHGRPQCRFELRRCASFRGRVDENRSVTAWLVRSQALSRGLRTRRSHARRAHRTERKAVNETHPRRVRHQAGTGLFEPVARDYKEGLIRAVGGTLVGRTERHRHRGSRGCGTGTGMCANGLAGQRRHLRRAHRSLG